MIDNYRVERSISCSSGFYVRQLAHDLGEHLGCGAHIVELRRLGVGDLDGADGYTGAALDERATDEERDEGRIEAHAMPIAGAFWCRISIQAYNSVEECDPLGDALKAANAALA